MTHILTTFDTNNWQENFIASVQDQATQALESGNILFFPQLPFILTETEKTLLSPQLIHSKTKNISFNKKTDQIRGIDTSSPQEIHVKQFMQRYADYADQFIKALFPRYKSKIKLGRTSFRPVEIKGRVTSYRKDDKRLHVDAFPSAPNQGERILRIFTNVNPKDARIWRVGESFETVAMRFLPQIPKPSTLSARLQYFLGLTKSLRTPYDHYMLHMHDRMKADEAYQQQAIQAEISFPSHSTWIVQTDHVSHAAIAGQHVLEQTFYLPVQAMMNEAHAPLRILEKLKGHDLT